MNYKSFNILIGSIFILAFSVTFSAQRIIMDIYPANAKCGLSGFRNQGWIFWNTYNDLMLLILSIIFLIIGIYFIFLSKIGKPKE